MEQTNLSSFQSKGKWPETWVIQYGPTSEPPFAVLASENNKKNFHNKLWLDQGKVEPKPFSAWNDTLSIVFDGYLYNQATLASELAQIQEIIPKSSPNGIIGLSEMEIRSLLSVERLFQPGNLELRD